MPAMRLRQIALVAAKREPVVEELCTVLGLKVCFNDPGVGKWGLVNALMPIGGNLLEVVAPVEENTSAGRYLERRHGDGGYMVILQCAEALAERKRILGMGVRSVATAERGDYFYTQFHPQDTGGILLTVDSVTPGADWQAEFCEWAPAGPDWKPAVQTHVTKALVGAEIQSDDPPAMAERWSRILDLPVKQGDDGLRRMKLTNAELRFVPIGDGRGRGLGAIDVVAADRKHILQEAAKRGKKRSDNQVELCGIRINLV
ncbi:MAG TPA: VOC family protein [Candidatus Sulfotelmatobacter sp.]|nr:VOC family protein [Candidatus Sulfotelmatobacter sp.]